MKRETPSLLIARPPEKFNIIPFLFKSGQRPSPAHFSKNTTVLELSEIPGELLERESSPAMFTKYDWQSEEILLNLRSLSTREKEWKEEFYIKSEHIEGFLGQDLKDAFELFYVAIG